MAQESMVTPGRAGPSAPLLAVRLLAASLLLAAGLPGRAQGQEDAERGVQTSMFGTAVRRSQLLVFPFFAYTWDHDYEYQPAALGYGLNQDLLGRYRSTQAQVFLAYGITDWLAVEFEASRIRATLDKAPDDTSAQPDRIVESGLADIEAQVRLRLLRERGGRPEVFASIELLPPQQKTKALIGDREWNVKGAIGVIRAFRWGTMTFRTTLEYNRGDKHPDLGETSLEYMRQLSSAGRLFLAIEGGEGGAPDDFALVTGLRWRLGERVFLQFDQAIGYILPKATDWEPQIGVVWTP